MIYAREYIFIYIYKLFTLGNYSQLLIYNASKFIFIIYG